MDNAAFGPTFCAPEQMHHHDKHVYGGEGRRFHIPQWVSCHCDSEPFALSFCISSNLFFYQVKIVC
jgi:hypothetical protein